MTPTGGLGKPLLMSLFRLLSDACDSEIFHGALQWQNSTQGKHRLLMKWLPHTASMMLLLAKLTKQLQLLSTSCKQEQQQHSDRQK